MVSRDHVQKALAAIKRQADYEFFFQELQSPEWITPLRAEGLLQNPPKPEVEGNFIRFPLWPESQYLVRMAEKAPDLVIETAMLIETDNPRVQEDFVEIGLRVSADRAVKLVPKIVTWVQNRYSRLITDKVSKLVRHLAFGKQLDAALALAKEILWFDPDPRLAEKQAERAKSELVFGTTPDPQARTEEYDYEQTLKQAIPMLAERDVTGTIDLLCSALARHIQLSNFDRESHQPYDGSIYWRSAVETGRWYQNYTDLLVDAIRDVAESYLGKNSPSFDAVEAPLLFYNWDIFTRIWLHLIRKFPAVAGERVERALTDRRFFTGHEFKHEYFCLIQDRFASLSNESKQRILRWIDAGPDEELLKLYARDWNGNPVGQDLIDRRVKAWKRDKLHAIRNSISNPWRKRYNELITELGEPQHAGFEAFHSEPEWGPKSPKSQDELAALSTDAIIAFLQSWQAPKEWMDPSPEGLARAFQAVVKRRANDLSAAASRFEDIDPTYARALISGLSDAVREGQQIVWQPVLNLCRWILNQPIGIPGRPKSDRRWDEGDPDWNWTRQSIARLLRDGCEHVSDGIEFEFRTLVWNLISVLTSDENPSADYEQKHAGSFRPITLSINTTRGEAMHAVMAYASWVRRHVGKAADFQAMPEVAQLLERRLALELEPTLTIRSVYGQSLPRLISIDREWVVQHLELIFPPERERRDYWDIAWSSYIIFNRCYTWVYDVLKAQYAEAVRRLSEGGLTTQEANPNESLAEHVMILYWIGHLKLDDVRLAEFYDRAPEELRAHALEFVGRALKHSDNVPAEQIERLKILWQKRLAAHTGKGKKGQSSEELAQFAVWFWSGKFDDDWALEQLTACMKASEDFEREFFVLERLSQISEKMPLKSLLALDLLIKAAHRKRDYFHGHDKAKVIIENGIRSSDAAAQKKAREIANYLLSLRYSEFRELAK